MINFSLLSSNHFFKLSSKVVSVSNSFNRLQFVPNFNDSFFPLKKNLGSVVSCYKSLFKSQLGHYSILHVKGIGFKVFYFSRVHSLYFLLGYNHIVKYKLPKEVFVKVRKQFLLFFSHHAQSLGTSIYQIQHLRYPDPYRGKGIRFRFQIIKFKPGKQR